MSSLVESRLDSDAAADCSTRSATMSGGRHGRLPLTSRPLAGAVSGTASSAACRVGASPSTTELDDRGSATVQQQGPPLSLFYNDTLPSPRLSLDRDFAEHSDVDEPLTEPDSPDNVNGGGVELQTASRNNFLTTDYNAAGEVRSRSADDVELRCVDDTRRSRDDSYVPLGGAIVVATNEEQPSSDFNSDSDERKIVFGIEPSERIVNAQCHPHVDNGDQCCNGKQSNSYYSTAGTNVTPKPEPAEARNMDKSLYGSQSDRANVKLEAHVDESQTNGSEDNTETVSPSHFKPSIAASSSLSEEMSTCSGTQHKSFGSAGSNDIISAMTATCTWFDWLDSIVH